MIRAFGLQPGEGRSAGLMGLHSFAMGLSTVFFETAASALFVARFGAQTLPWIYIAAAVVNTGIGALFQAARARLPFRQVMAGLLAFLLLGVAGLRLSLAMSEAAALVFSLLVFYRVLSALTDLEYWAVASRLYDVRQAKRLFGLIGTGEVIARIAGAFAVPLLVPQIGVLNLLWLSASALLACLMLLLELLPRASGGQASPREAGRRAAEAGGLLPMLGDSYLRGLFALAFFSVLAKYFVDFAFLAEMRARTDDVASFAAFFGVFSGVTQVLSLLTRLLVSGPFLARFGIRAGLLVLPLAHIACTAGILLAAAVPGAGGAVFWLVIGNQGIYKVLRHPIDNPCFKVLYQPLSPKERLGVQVAVETAVTPLTTGLAGVVMLLFASGRGFDGVAFAWLLLASFLPWAGVAVRTGRRYAGALVRALQGRLVPVEALDLRDDASRRALEDALGSPRPGDVLFALELLVRADPPRALRKLRELAIHPAPEVRRAAFAYLERSGDRGAAPLLARCIASEAVAEVRAAAIAALAALLGPTAEPQLLPLLGDHEARVRAAALAGLLRSGGAGSPRRAELLRWAGSPRVEERLDAAAVIGALARGAFDSVLAGLLTDADRRVRAAAAQAAGRAGGAEVWGVLIAALTDRRGSAAAARALQAGGEAVLRHIAPALAAYPDPYVSGRLLRVAAGLPGETARALLAEHAFAPDAFVRHTALAALAGAGHRFPEHERPRLLESLREEARLAASCLAAARDLGGGDAAKLLKGALWREAELSRDRALLLLACSQDRAALERARAAITRPEKEKRALALEVLDVTLPAEEKELALPLCEEPDRRLAALLELFPLEPRPELEWLRSLVRGTLPVRPFARAAALLAAARGGHRELLADVLAAAGPGGDFLVSQSAAFARAALQGGLRSEAEGSRTKMLAIERVITLKAARMFEEAPEEVLAEVAAILEEVEVETGTAVFDKGEAGDSMYIIAEGRVRVSDGEHTVALLGPREVFGELALLDPEPRLFTVAAIEDSRLLRLDREAFLELMAGNIEIVRGVLHVLCERLRKAEAEIVKEGSA